MFGLIALVNLIAIGETTPVQETEKWIGPVLTSTASLAATFFAYMTARDRLRYDANIVIMTARIKDLEVDATDAKSEAKEAKAEAVSLRERYNKTVANFQAYVLKKPLPHPEEMKPEEPREPKSGEFTPSSSPKPGAH